MLTNTKPIDTLHNEQTHYDVYIISKATGITKNSAVTLLYVAASLTIRWYYCIIIRKGSRRTKWTLWGIFKEDIHNSQKPCFGLQQKALESLRRYYFCSLKTLMNRNKSVGVELTLMVLFVGISVFFI